MKMAIIDSVQDCEDWIEYYFEEINNLKLLKLELIEIQQKKEEEKWKEKRKINTS